MLRTRGVCNISRQALSTAKRSGVAATPRAPIIMASWGEKGGPAVSGAVLMLRRHGLITAAAALSRRPPVMVRTSSMCTKASGGDKKAAADEGGEKADKEEGEGSKSSKQQQQEEEEAEPPLEPISWGRALAYLAALGIGLGSLYMIFEELMPSRMSANYLFGEAFDVVKANHDIRNRFGEPLKAYGRDGGGRREGRRNFIEHKTYTADDGTKRLRIRFNVEGPFGHAFVFAEVTDAMKSGEWVYVLVQDLQSGKVYTVEDNRAMLAAMSRSVNDGERAALQALIKGGGEQR